MRDGVDGRRAPASLVEFFAVLDAVELSEEAPYLMTLLVCSRRENIAVRMNLPLDASIP